MEGVDGVEGVNEAKGCRVAAALPVSLRSASTSRRVDFPQPEGPMMADSVPVEC